MKTSGHLDASGECGIKECGNLRTSSMIHREYTFRTTRFVSKGAVHCVGTFRHSGRLVNQLLYPVLRQVVSSNNFSDARLPDAAERSTFRKVHFHRV